MLKLKLKLRLKLRLKLKLKLKLKYFLTLRQASAHFGDPLLPLPSVWFTQVLSSHKVKPYAKLGGGGLPP